MNVQSNSYTFIYASIMIIIVALGLSFTSIALKNKQLENIEKEKKQSILASIGKNCSREEAVNLYSKYVTKTYAIDYKGNKQEKINGFNINTEKELTKPIEQRLYPIYECNIENKKLYVFPLRGKGLWGPIWGFVALKDDFNTIFGVTFDHKSETPGLGAEIATKNFQKQFAGKQIFDDMKKFVSILVKKPAQFDKKNKHQVKGLSGATLTCNGLQNMMEKSLKPYETFFNKNK